MNDYFSDQNLSLESDSFQLNQTQIPKEASAATFYKVHLLSPIFKEWRFVSIRRKKLQELEILFLRWEIEHIQRIFFFKMINTFEFRNKLHNLGSKMLVNKHFFLWIKFVRKQFQEKYNYREVILARRRIYNQNYFKKWRRALILKRRYQYYARNEEKFFCLKIIKAFQICIEKEKKFKETVKYLQKIRLQGVLIQWYKNWRYSRITKYIKRNRLHFLRQTFFNQWYDSMKIQIKLRRKYRYIFNIHNQQILQKLFDLWYFKYFRINDIKDKYQHLLNLTQIRIKADAFHRIYSTYNYKMYLLQTEENLLPRIEVIKMRHYFSLWTVRTFQKQRYIEAVRNIIVNLYRHRLRCYFQKWKTKHTIVNYYQTKMNKIRNSYKIIYTRSCLLQWYSEYKYLIMNKQSINRATLFRSICLKLKAFRAFQCNVKYNELIKEQNEKYKLLVQIIYFYKWKRKYIKYKRRFILISTVLKNWVKTVQKKMLHRWISYINMKHQKQIEYSKAQLVFNQCKVAFTIDSFIAGCPEVLNENTVNDKDNPDADLPDFHFINENTNEMEPIVLNEPKIPSFMKNSSSPKRDMNDHLLNIESQFQELARKCEKNGSNDDDRSRMLFLIKEMNRIRTQFNVS